MTLQTFQKFSRYWFLVLLCLGVGFLSSRYMTTDTMIWYQSLNLSPLTPPDGVFMPAWTILYISMGLSAALVWDEVSPRPFAFQLVANGAWSFFFFYLRMPWLAFIDILLLLFLILWTIKVFSKASKIAAWLLIPYLLWTIFASYLNGYVVFVSNTLPGA